MAEEVTSATRMVSSKVQYTQCSAQTCEQQPYGDAGIMQSGVAREDLFITIKTVRGCLVRARQRIWNFEMRSDRLVLLNMRVEIHSTGAC